MAGLCYGEKKKSDTKTETFWVYMGHHLQLSSIICNGWDLVGWLGFRRFIIFAEGEKEPVVSEKKLKGITHTH